MTKGKQPTEREICESLEVERLSALISTAESEIDGGGALVHQGTNRAAKITKVGAPEYPVIDVGLRHHSPEQVKKAMEAEVERRASATGANGFHASHLRPYGANSISSEFCLTFYTIA